VRFEKGSEIRVLIQGGDDMLDLEKIKLLERILVVEERIYAVLRPRLSATLHFKQKESRMPATILVGKTASSNFQEWSGPNGTGDKLPSAGPVTFTSSDSTVATVDPNSGLVTGVAATGGSAKATITGVDSANNLTASDTITVVETASSATLSLVAN